MSQSFNEEPVYQLFSFYNREALEHAAWLTGFIVATFTFMGLAVRNSPPFWGWWLFFVMFVLGTLMSYFSGRLIYFSTLVTILTTYPSIVDPFFPSIYSVASKTMPRLKEIKDENNGNWIAYQFRSFRQSAIFISIGVGIALGAGLFVLGWLVLHYK